MESFFPSGSKTRPKNDQAGKDIIASKDTFPRDTRGSRFSREAVSGVGKPKNMINNTELNGDESENSIEEEDEDEDYGEEEDEYYGEEEDEEENDDDDSASDEDEEEDASSSASEVELELNLSEGEESDPLELSTS